MTHPEPRLSGGRRRLILALLALAACGTVLAVTRAAAPSEPSPQAGASSKPTPPRVLEVWGGEPVLVYDDYEGTFQVKAIGDRGSVHEASYRFNGFYVRPILTLSKALQGQLGSMAGVTPEVDKYIDIYEIAPKSVTAYIHSAATRWCTAPKGGLIHEAYAGLINKAFVCPEPPPPDAAPGESRSVGAWMYKRTNDFERTGYEVRLRVTSRQAAGGDAVLEFHTHAMTQGTKTHYYSRSTRSDDGIGHMQLTSQSRGEAQLSVSTGGFFWTLPHRVIGKPFGIGDISLAFDGSADYRTRDCGGGFTTESDTAYRLDYHLHIAGKIKIEADLEPVDAQEASWSPRPNDQRKYKLTLKEPGVESVQAVRFTLTDVSNHPGIATNAGNHALGDSCPDCGGRKTEISGRTVVMDSSGGKRVSVSRAYFTYNECPLDRLPDVFFKDKDNDGYEMGDQAVSEGLTYSMGPQIVRKRGIGESETVTLTVKDGAASARLQAEVMVGGLWYPATPVGKTASGDGKSLLLPLDKDGNGIHDDFQTIWGVDNPDGDSESHQGGKYFGDGLTVFEEYRGVYIQGRFKRLSPLHKDLFVHDYSGQFTGGLAAAGMKYSGLGIDVWALRPSEHRKDVVNWRTASHKAGDQYMLVVMLMSQAPGFDLGGYGGMASDVGPPTEAHNTIIMSSAPPVGTYTEALAGSLAHEIGHNVNCPHHGTGEGYRTLGGAADEAFIACEHGQHSGDRDCIMAYNAADYFFKGRPVPMAGLDALLAQGKIIPYPDPLGTRRAFCTTTKGTGVAGDAEAGAGECASRIKIKSY